jgi:hypothetical protein
MIAREKREQALEEATTARTSNQPEKTTESLTQPGICYHIPNENSAIDIPPRGHSFDVRS